MPHADPTERILAGAAALGVDLDEPRAARMHAHLELVRAANESFNLTRITDRDAMVRDHVLDALALLPALVAAGLEGSLASPALDVGSGAGFPGIPLAIARPDVGWILLESRGPKAAFLGEAVDVLQLPNVEVVQARARDLVHVEPAHAAIYRFVTARAVAHVARVLREVKALVAPGGIVAHFKGPNYDAAEQTAGEAAAREHHFEPTAEIPTTQPNRSRRFLFHRRTR